MATMYSMQASKANYQLGQWIAEYILTPAKGLTSFSILQILFLLPSADIACLTYLMIRIALLHSAELIVTETGWTDNYLWVFTFLADLWVSKSMVSQFI